MAYIERNLNPLGKRTGDCVIRSIATVMNEDWDSTYKCIGNYWVKKSG